MKIALVTGNPNKAKEAAAIIGAEFDIRPLDVPEIQSYSLEEIVAAKVRAAYDLVGGPVLVEDTAFDIAVLGGFPGPFVKFWFDNVGYDGVADIAERMGKKGATARSAVGFFDGARRLYVEKAVPGTLVKRTEGDGWGFDHYFVPDGYGRTYAQLGNEEKYKISHRHLSLTAMRQKLREAGVLS